MREALPPYWVSPNPPQQGPSLEGGVFDKIIICVPGIYWQSLKKDSCVKEANIIYLFLFLITARWIYIVGLFFYMQNTHFEEDKEKLLILSA